MQFSGLFCSAGKGQNCLPGGFVEQREVFSVCSASTGVVWLVSEVFTGHSAAITVKV